MKGVNSTPTKAEGQILVYQVPIPEPLRFLEPRETETRKMHALEEYGLMHVKLYEDIASTLTPDPWYVRFYYSHPPALQRIHRMAGTLSKA